MKSRVSYQKIISAFGGAALYIKKDALRYLGIKPKDEVKVELKDGCVIISKPAIDCNEINNMLEKLKQSGTMNA